MAMKLHTLAGDGLFDILGKAFEVIDTLNTARKTTIPDKAEAFVIQVEQVTDLPLEYLQTVQNLPNAVSSWQQSGGSLAQAIQQTCEDVLSQMVADDGQLADQSLTAGLEYLIAQMETATDYVNANAVTATVATGGSNVGDVDLCVSTLGAAGRRQNIFAETISVYVEAVYANRSAMLQFAGEWKETDKLGFNWPAGTGCTATLATTTAAASTLAVGDISDNSTANVPDGWIVTIGTPGTTLAVTAIEEQTVTLSGSPTGGAFVLLWTNQHSVTRSTAPIAYNATGLTVQAALQSIPGLEQVAVTDDGNSPNYTYTVSFQGVGQAAQLTSANYLIGGTSPAIAHATTVAGNAHVYVGQAMQLIGDGSQLTALYAPASLQNQTVYFCHFHYATATTGTPVGTLKIEIVDGIGGSILTDTAGNSIAWTKNVVDIPAGLHADAFSFALPATTQQPVFLRVRLSTAMHSGDSLYLDEIAITPGTELYPGGPFAAAFAGVSPASTSDTWTITTTNDRGGKFQTWFNRVFDTAEKDLILPTVGVTLIPDTLIA